MSKTQKSSGPNRKKSLKARGAKDFSGSGRALESAALLAAGLVVGGKAVAADNSENMAVENLALAPTSDAEALASDLAAMDEQATLASSEAEESVEASADAAEATGDPVMLADASGALGIVTDQVIEAEISQSLQLAQTTGAGTPAPVSAPGGSGAAAGGTTSGATATGGAATAGLATGTIVAGIAAIAVVAVAAGGGGDDAPAPIKPVASAASATGLEDATSIIVMLSATDADGTIASYTISSLPTNGTLYSNAALTTVVAAGGTVTSSSLYFKPAANFNGTASFNYTATDNAGQVSNSVAATITVTAVNDAPVAAAASPSGAEDAASIPVTLAATDVDGTIASYTISSLPGNGTLYSDAAGTMAVALGATVTSASLYFKPALNFNGTSSFNYTATDNGGLVSSIASASITVSSVNDAPVATAVSGSGVNGATPSITVMLSATDVDVGGSIASYTITSLPLNGTLYSASNLAQSSQITAGASVTSATVYFVPTVGTSGTATFNYTALDNLGLASAPAVASIVVAPAPVVLGFAAKGPLAGATVFYDMDGDGVLSQGDISTMTNDGSDPNKPAGTYELDSGGVDVTGKKVIVQGGSFSKLDANGNLVDVPFTGKLVSDNAQSITPASTLLAAGVAPADLAALLGLTGVGGAVLTPTEALAALNALTLDSFDPELTGGVEGAALSLFSLIDEFTSADDSADKILLLGKALGNALAAAKASGADLSNPDVLANVNTLVSGALENVAGAFDDNPEVTLNDPLIDSLLDAANDQVTEAAEDLESSTFVADPHDLYAASIGATWDAVRGVYIISETQAEAMAAANRADVLAVRTSSYRGLGEEAGVEAPVVVQAEGNLLGNKLDLLTLKELSLMGVDKVDADPALPNSPLILLAGNLATAGGTGLGGIALGNGAFQAIGTNFQELGLEDDLIGLGVEIIGGNDPFGGFTE